MIPEWSDVKRHIVGKMSAAQNELLTCPLDHVERVRGRIEAYRATLALEGTPQMDRALAQNFLNAPG